MHLSLPFPDFRNNTHGLTLIFSKPKPLGLSVYLQKHKKYTRSAFTHPYTPRVSSAQAL